ncbi:monovalent cation/H+ antiporter subunit D [Burkholderiaceae bacterium FT117]|uniref:monovalent cation/H+ antiporter subunit D n=1 Tax=Zeimonas sediminis TaxID=2944268 RepID=UPI00234312B7|nr:monovalent cation/H+ antiporter subunit D [Zeimonas sediminis]MCM5570809.1 monovalent cation/H+ antiporter subunit D [Zeimonas sediminis]
MNWPHLIVVPVVLPLLAGAALLLLERRSERGGAQPGGNPAALLSLLSVIAQLLVALMLAARAAGGGVEAYLLGNWQAPFGIALALDRLSAMMLVLTALVALGSALYARAGDAARGPHFHALFQFQLMGLNGAFLTADLFNLFVFFEVLLIASYGLLLHGGGAARLKASIHYVAFNLAGSSLFLIAVALLYGLTGTLNMADLAERVAALPGTDTAMIRAAGLLLLVVFSVKAALLPLYFWLPETYGAATAPVAALFAIMTKVGVYSIARVYTLVFGDDGGTAANVAWPWLPLLALGTLALGAVGTLAATRLRGVVAYLVVGSAGTLLLALGLGNEASVSAGLFYMINSTLMAGALFLLVDRIAAARAVQGDHLRPDDFQGNRAMLGAAFFTCAIAAGGLPPLAGFLGKAMLLEAATPTTLAVWTWIVVLGAGLGTIVALSRAGSLLFWRSGPRHAQHGEEAHGHSAHGHGTQGPASHGVPEARDGTGLAPGQALGAGLLVALLPLLALFGGPVHGYTTAAAEQLFERRAYIDAVLGTKPVPAAIDVRREMRERGDIKGAKKP